MPSPAQSGYRFPAEWEAHTATWLTWPWPDGCSFPENLTEVEEVYARLIQTLTPHETVRLNVWDGEMESRVREFLSGFGTSLENVEFHRHPAREPWCRDHGPVFLTAKGQRKAVVNWGYNAWGEKYPSWDEDNGVPGLVAAAQDLTLFEPEMILEGGSIETDGKGTLLTTESCLLNGNRNPTLNREAIELRLREFLGVNRILWLGDGIAGDDTDGHIDDLARFTAPDTIVTAVEDDPADVNHAQLQDNLKRLRSMKDAAGQPYRIVTLPMPLPRYYGELRLPASYANFYIANQIVIVPTFDDPSDARAIEILQSEFPDRRVIGLDSTELIIGQGSYHCITQQEPA